MSQRKWIVSIALVFTLITGLACTAEDGTSDGKSQPQKQPTPEAVHIGAGEPGPNPNVNNPGPVRADPSAHDPNPEYAEMHVWWLSETGINPKVEYSLEAGGPQIPGTNMKAYKIKEGKDAGLWQGAWILEIPVHSEQRIGFTAFGTSSFRQVKCFIVHHGIFKSQQTSVRNCASSIEIP